MTRGIVNGKPRPFPPLPCHGNIVRWPGPILVVAGAGYLFGHAVGLMLHDAHRYELVLLLGIAGAGLIVWAVRKGLHTSSNARP